MLTRKLVLKRKANELEAVYKKIRKLSDLTEIEKETDNGLRQIIKEGYVSSAGSWTLYRLIFCQCMAQIPWRRTLEAH
jgi:hypothetical protein